MADTYKIVKASDLNTVDSGLTAIANALRVKLNDNTLTFTFPTGYIEAIQSLTYTPTVEPEPENPETEPEGE